MSLLLLLSALLSAITGLSAGERAAPVAAETVAVVAAAESAQVSARSRPAVRFAQAFDRIGTITSPTRVVDLPLRAWPLYLSRLRV